MQMRPELLYCNAGDLLGGDMPTDNPPASSSGGMFAGLDVDISSNQQPAQPPNASFLDLGTSPAASHAAHQLSPMDALAALHSSGGTSTSTAQHQQTGSTSGNRPSANGTAQNADDLFGGLQTSASTAQGQQSGGDMFGGLSMQTRQSPVSAMNGTGGNSQGLLPGPGTAGAAAADLFGGLSLGKHVTVLTSLACICLRTSRYVASQQPEQWLAGSSVDVCMYCSA